METIVIMPFGGCELNVSGYHIDSKDTEEGKEYFEIKEIENLNDDIIELLEWSNSKPAGSILSIIEELVLEEINNK